jgi:hypothetical protein
MAAKLIKDRALRGKQTPVRAGLAVGLADHLQALLRSDRPMSAPWHRPPAPRGRLHGDDRAAQHGNGLIIPAKATQGCGIVQRRCAVAGIAVIALLPLARSAGAADLRT